MAFYISRSCPSKNLELANQPKTMTVKELSNELKVSDQTIRNVVKELFDPSKLLWKVVNGGNTLFLT